MKQIDLWLPQAIEAIEAHIQQGDAPIPRQYNGYIAAFGAAVLQSGLLAALAFNCNTNHNAEQERPKVMAALYQMIAEKRRITNAQGTLLDYALKQTQPGAQTQLKKEILLAATALKLALRTFKLQDAHEESAA